MTKKLFLILFLFFILVVNIPIVSSGSQDHYREVYQTDFSDGSPYMINYSNDDFNLYTLDDTGAYESSFDSGIMWINDSDYREGMHYRHNGDTGHTVVDFTHDYFINQVEFVIDFFNWSQNYLSIRLNNTDNNQLCWIRISRGIHDVTVEYNHENNGLTQIGVFKVMDIEKHLLFIDFKLLNFDLLNVTLTCNQTVLSTNMNLNTDNSQNSYEVCSINHSFFYGSKNYQYQNYTIKNILYVNSMNRKFYYESFLDQYGNLFTLGSLGDTDPNDIFNSYGTYAFSDFLVYDQSDYIPNGFKIPFALPGLKGDIKTFKVHVHCGTTTHTVPELLGYKNSFGLQLIEGGRHSQIMLPSVMLYKVTGLNNPGFTLVWEDIDFSVNQPTLPHFTLDARVVILPNFPCDLNVLVTYDTDNIINDFRADQVNSVQWIMPCQTWTGATTLGTGVFGYIGWDSEEDPYVPPPPPDEITITVQKHFSGVVEYNQQVSFSVVVGGTYRKSWVCIYNESGNRPLINKLGQPLSAKLTLGVNDIVYQHLKQYGHGSFSLRCRIQDVPSRDHVDWSEPFRKIDYTVNDTDMTQPGGNGRDKLTISNMNDQIAYPLRSYVSGVVDATEDFYVRVLRERTNTYYSFNHTGYKADILTHQPQFFADNEGWHRWEIWSQGNHTHPESGTRFYVFTNTESDQNYLRTTKGRYPRYETVRIEYGHTSILSSSVIRLEVLNVDYSVSKSFLLSDTSGYIDYVPDQVGNHLCYFTFNDTRINYPEYEFQVMTMDENTIMDYTSSSFGALIGIGIVLSFGFFTYFVTHSGTAFFGLVSLMFIFFAIPGGPIIFFPVQIAIFGGLGIVLLILFMLFGRR